MKNFLTPTPIPIISPPGRQSTLTWKREYFERKMYWCEFCSESFSSLPLMKGHQDFVHNRMRFGCGECERSFARQYLLHIHQRKESHTHSELRYTCGECEERCKNQNDFVQHRFSTHGRSFHHSRKYETSKEVVSTSCFHSLSFR